MCNASMHAHALSVFCTQQIGTHRLRPARSNYLILRVEEPGGATPVRLGVPQPCRRGES